MADDQNLTPARSSHGPRPGAPETSPGQAGEMFTAKELQQILKISVKTIYRYVQHGLIPYVRIQSNVRFPKRQILEWIERQSYQPWSPARSAARRR
jgi:excisionase family DNA binding protein